MGKVEQNFVKILRGDNFTSKLTGKDISKERSTAKAVVLFTFLVMVVSVVKSVAEVM